MNLRLGLLTVVILGFQGARAESVYVQGPVWTPGNDVGNSWTSHTDSTNSGYRTSDNFTPTVSAIVSHASWYGIYLNGNTPNTSTWDVSFYADNAGAPGTLLSSNLFTAAQVTTTNVGPGIFIGSPVTVYRFDVNVSNLSVTAGTTYWFSPLSKATDFNPFFSWISGSGGDGLTFQDQYSNGSVVATVPDHPHDRAFALDTVPEPSTYLILGAGLGALALLRRR